MSDPFIHPTAVVDPEARVGAGTKIWLFCHVMAGARIGERCVLGQNVTVAPGVSVGDGVKLQDNVSVFQGRDLGGRRFLWPERCVH